MNKPASELIALDKAGLDAAVRECARITAPEITDEEYEKIVAEDSLRYRNTRLDMERTILAYLSAAGSERAGVDALREALRPFAKMAGAMYVSGHCGGASPEDWPDRWHVTVQGGKHFHTPQQHGGYLTVADFRRAAEALATPPAQPAPSKCEDCSGSGLALNSAGEPDICKTCGGNTVAPHGKPDGALREALSALVNAVSNMRVPQNVADAALQITIIGPVLERAKAALHSAAETSPGDVLAMKEALARAFCVAKEVNPDCLHQNYDDEPVDHTDAHGRTFHFGWRNQLHLVDAAMPFIDRLDIEAEAKSQEPDAGQLSVRGFREDAFRSMEVQICGDTRTVQFGVEDHGGDHPTMPCCALSWTDAADLASWVQSCIVHPTTKPEAPAVGVDAIAGIIDPVAFDPISLSDNHPGWEHRRETARETATAIAAIIAGGR